MSHLRAGDIDWHYRDYGDAKDDPMLLLHGFTGTAESWKDFVDSLGGALRAIAPDLPGHGKTPFPAAGILPLRKLADALAEFIQQSVQAPVPLLGYSMGGRVALHVALQHPQWVRALILIGASPGIANDEERRERWERDFALAREIRVKGLGWFADYWAHQPIFATQQALPDSVQKRLRRQRQANTKEGLAFALENWGPGQQEYLLPRAGELSLPLLLIAGDLDEKYCAINRRVAERAVNARVTVKEIAQAGHAAQLEQPEAVAAVVNEFLSHLQE